MRRALPRGGYAGWRSSTCPTSTLPGSGIGRPSSVSPWRCRAIASPMSRSASARVAPAATTPERAGTKALQPVAVCSYTTVQVLNGPPSDDRIGGECCSAYGRQLLARLAGHHHSARLRRVAEPSAASALHHLLPTALLQHVDHLANLHRGERRGGLCQPNGSRSKQRRTRFRTSSRFEYECLRPTKL